MPGFSGGIIVANESHPSLVADRRVLVTGQHPLAIGVVRWFIDAGAQVALVASRRPHDAASATVHIECSFADERAVGHAATPAPHAPRGTERAGHRWVAGGRSCTRGVTDH